MANGKSLRDITLLEVFILQPRLVLRLVQNGRPYKVLVIIKVIFF